MYLLLIGPGLLAGLILSPVWRGLLDGTMRLAWRFAESERRQANRLLETHLPPLHSDADRRERTRVLAMLLVKLPIALAGLAVAAAPALLTIGLLALGITGLAGGGDRVVGPWALGPATGIVLCLLALPAAVLSIAALELDGAAARNLAARLLRSRMPEGGPVRELLAERLGDTSLQIVYWLPQKEIFVDDRGRAVTLPAPGSGRTWTVVEHAGTRVAALVHDAELDASPELISAAASAAALAIDNERLKAELRARVEELRVSRVRIVEAADDARRRIERDLHDGAQQQLVSLALELRMLRTKVRGTDAEAHVDALSERLAAALADLRELARGIHPAILTDRGLAPAIGALADRGTIPIDTDVRVDRRLDPAVEAAAYFLVAEALTNVSRYAHATSARVDVAREGDEIVVLVSDDGVGGVDLEAGSGLRGLQDRLATVGGTLSIDSPPGAGTRLLARIPCP
jgi:signal transduction histidine kinase